MNKTVAKMEKLLTKMDKLRTELAAAEAEYTSLRNAEASKVEVFKLAKSVQLVCGNRIVNAKLNRYGRYDVTEGKTVLRKDYREGIPALRFAVAVGTI